MGKIRTVLIKDEAGVVQTTCVVISLGDGACNKYHTRLPGYVGQDTDTLGCLSDRVNADGRAVHGPLRSLGRLAVGLDLVPKPGERFSISGKVGHTVGAVEALGQQNEVRTAVHLGGAADEARGAGQVGGLDTARAAELDERKAHGLGKDELGAGGHGTRRSSGQEEARLQGGGTGLDAVRCRAMQCDAMRCDTVGEDVMGAIRGGCMHGPRGTGQGSVPTFRPPPATPGPRPLCRAGGRDGGQDHVAREISGLGLAHLHAHGRGGSRAGVRVARPFQAGGGCLRGGRRAAGGHRFHGRRHRASGLGHRSPSVITRWTHGHAAGCRLPRAGCRPAAARASHCPPAATGSPRERSYHAAACGLVCCLSGPLHAAEQPVCRLRLGRPRYIPHVRAPLSCTSPYPSPFSLRHVCHPALQHTVQDCHHWLW